MGDLLKDAVQQWPQHTALIDSANSAITYQAYLQEAQKIANRLNETYTGNQPIAIIAGKSIGSLLLIQGISQAQRCYIPLNPAKPIQENLKLCQQYGISHVIIEKSLAESAIVADDHKTLNIHQQSFLLAHLPGGTQQPSDDLAYILFTSGSTGIPKGVMHSHGNALAFLHWAQDIFKPETGEVFTSIAPWCFDLSVLDIYLPMLSGSSLYVFSEEETQNPRLLAAYMAEQKVTSLYATPTLLQTMLHYGRLQDHDLSNLKRVLFAGEVFPIKPLNDLRAIWTQALFFNLYGPTETNVCTYYALPEEIETNRQEPYPIGKACPYAQTQIDDGQLWVSGQSVAQGYYQNQELTQQWFQSDKEGNVWYNTGDLMHINEEGNYCFDGRKDRQIKRHGYRIELDEIERYLHQMDEVANCAVYLKRGNDKIIQASVVLKQEKITDIQAIRAFLLSRLEKYKLPDTIDIVTSLPTTATGKVDYTTLMSQG